MTDPQEQSKARGLARLVKMPRALLLRAAGARRAQVEARLRQEIKNADMARGDGVATLIGRRPLIER